MTTHDTAQDRLDEIRRRHTPAPGGKYCPQCAAPAPCPTLLLCGQPARRKAWALSHRDTGAVVAMFSIESAAQAARAHCSRPSAMDINLYHIRTDQPTWVQVYEYRAVVTGKGDVRRRTRDTDRCWNYETSHLDGGPVVHSGKSDRGGRWVAVTGLDEAAVSDLLETTVSHLVEAKKPRPADAGPVSG